MPLKVDHKRAAVNEALTELVEKQLPVPTHALWRLQKVVDCGTIDKEDAFREKSKNERGHKRLELIAQSKLAQV